MNKEIWVSLSDIKDYYMFPNYSVSNFGRVRNDRYNRIMEGYTDNYGYRQVCIRNDLNQVKYVKIHRLVALAFIPNPYGLPEVNHKDEDKTNNYDWNLEWGTAKYNCNYGTRNKRIVKAQTGQTRKSVTGGKNGRAKSVVQLSLSGELIREFSCMKDAREYGFLNYTSISDCCNGKRNSYKGYKWMYKEDYYAK